MSKAAFGPFLVTTRAMALPEIISLVLFQAYRNFIHHEDRTIFACTLVTTAWHAEASRYLWQVVDCFVGSHPTIRDLIAVDPGRRQLYADHIRELRITNEDDDDGQGLWEGTFHPQLSNLSFPRLEKLDMDGPFASDPDPLEYETPSLTQYIQPRLNTITIYSFKGPASLVISDKVLTTIMEEARNLKKLNVRIESNDHSISPQLLLGFLQAVDLTELSLGDGFSSVTSSEAFETLARSSTLRCLDIPAIYDSWVENLAKRFQLGKTLSMEPFKCLETLECSISSTGLQELLPSLSGLRSLGLEAHEGSTQMFRIIANAGLEHLKDFRLQPCLSLTVDAQDLLRLVMCAPHLGVLKLPQIYNKSHTLMTPIMENLDDIMMEQIAAHLPSLWNLKLVFHQQGVSEKTLISLGTHCLNLQICTLTADTNSANLLQQTRPGFFPKLQELEIFPSADVGYDENGIRTQVTPGETLQDMAEQLTARMPALFWGNFWNETDWNSAIRSAIDAKRGNLWGST
ncbi:hypothetical protein K461DRAFT_324921 [Myriangium duriaei CBS 260.36]|uniref:Uncharacterized protein n=1 Tax=Myriangium duriaei CBS 260.36 TaxID=1168546 RepID=A0A9P4IQN1_9PEZI|nr:hypothetical protein K461DRAFT_324921 [Myriangium duriaei CBS 260.36]